MILRHHVIVVGGPFFSLTHTHYRRTVVCLFSPIVFVHASFLSLGYKSRTVDAKIENPRIAISGDV